MSLSNKEIVQKVNEAFHENSTEKFIAYCADDVSWNMLGDQVIKGKDAVKNFCDKMPPEPPKFTVQEIIGDRDMVVSNGIMMMKNKEGVEEDYAFCDVYKIKNEKIQELTTYMVKTSPAK